MRGAVATAPRLVRVTFRLYDTATREVRDFVPLEEGKAGLYVCGLTVQSEPHIGAHHVSRGQPWQGQIFRDGHVENEAPTFAIFGQEGESQGECSAWRIDLDAFTSDADLPIDGTKSSAKQR